MFFGTDNAVDLFDADGTFPGTRTLTFGGAGNIAIYDAGTEANPERHTAFLNQAADNTGGQRFWPHLACIEALRSPAKLAALCRNETY